MSRLQPEAVVTESPAEAQLIAAGLRLLASDLRRRGDWATAGRIAGLTEPFTVLGGTTLIRRDDGRLDTGGSAPLMWLGVGEVASRLGLSESYVRRLARTRLRAAGLARQERPSGPWQIAEEAVPMIRPGRQAA